jgi:DNA-binding NarL/FixJ family response regulator
MMVTQRPTQATAPIGASNGELAMIRILIADDHEIVRAGLKQFIASEGDLQVAAEASSGAETVDLVRNGEFDIVLLDIRMPDGSGIDTLKKLKTLRPELPVLMLSGFAEEQYALNLLRAGAAGYVTKEAAPAELVKAIRTVMVGRKYVSSELAQILAAGVSGDTDKPLHAQLSQREFQIFCKLATGESVSKIADELLISVKTVSTYRTRILQKMNLHSNADITYYAIKNDLIQ